MAVVELAAGEIVGAVTDPVERENEIVAARAHFDFRIRPVVADEEQFHHVVFPESVEARVRGRVRNALIL